ncbi:hypothetical protein [Neotabrizicola shimadae]|uniref:Uncharacterized protein n=1 Tax=Neotabrizicola shimadae TaxID=2807096 RepID=A0A8G1EER5_9RHOB|nr:hypothetical protein [Neotabrizicola shimadae]QYZ71638.1 hypothetical protein JO391_09150 [Neotabrizicola shimadae]
MRARSTDSVNAIRTSSEAANLIAARHRVTGIYLPKLRATLNQPAAFTTPRVSKSMKSKLIRLRKPLKRLNVAGRPSSDAPVAA